MVRTNCWFMDGRAACREPAELVEVVPGKLRRLCQRHEKGIRQALARPDVYRVSWGMPLSEEIAELRERIRTLENELKDLTPPPHDSALAEDEGPDDIAEYDDDWEDPWWSMSDQERVAYWDSPAGRTEKELNRLEGRLGALLEGQEYYHRREEPAVRVRVVTENLANAQRT